MKDSKANRGLQWVFFDECGIWKYTCMHVLATGSAQTDVFPENIWFTVTHVTNSIRPKDKTYLMLHFSFKIAWIYINKLSMVTLPVSVLDSFFSTAWRLASNMSCLWSGVPPHSQTESPTESGGHYCYPFTSCSCENKWCQHTPLPEKKINKCQKSNSKQVSIDYTDSYLVSTEF